MLDKQSRDLKWVAGEDLEHGESNMPFYVRVFIISFASPPQTIHMLSFKDVF